MCTILLAWQWSDDAPLVLVANRDELVSRASDPPQLLQQSPPLWGGRDRLAGGTWLAVDPTGRLCAVTNRHPGGQLPTRDPNRRSRGVLPTDVLNAGGDPDALAYLSTLEPADYNPVNVIYLSGSAAAWVALDDEIGRRSGQLAPGVHVLTEQNPDDLGSDKCAQLLQRAQAVAANTQDLTELLEGFRGLLRSHDRAGAGPETAACIHEERFGTVSSASVIATPTGVVFEHAEGHPCVTQYRRVLG